MYADGNHGGPSEAETHVPLYVLGSRDFTLAPDLAVRQVELAGTLCALLGLGDHDLPVAEGVLKAPSR